MRPQPRFPENRGITGRGLAPIPALLRPISGYTPIRLSAPEQIIDWFERLAVEAVICEPVSAGRFPVPRENTGNFS
jgi:hypothetical protein